MPNTLPRVHCLHGVELLPFVRSCTDVMLHCRVVGRTLDAEQHPSDQHGRVAQQALRAVHARGFCHRDLSDDNIMLTRAADGSDDVRLVDFGCSSDCAPAELQEAEERELASVFAAKASGCCTTLWPHECTSDA
jgi:serine/threonine protein kinase